MWKILILAAAAVFLWWQWRRRRPTPHITRPLESLRECPRCQRYTAAHDCTESDCPLHAPQSR